MLDSTWSQTLFQARLELATNAIRISHIYVRLWKFACPFFTGFSCATSTVAENKNNKNMTVQWHVGTFVFFFLQNMKKSSQDHKFLCRSPERLMETAFIFLNLESSKSETQFWCNQPPQTTLITRNAILVAVIPVFRAVNKDCTASIRDCADKR